MDHFREAERLIEQAETWADADQGWRASMSTRERIERRQADFLGAIAHAVTGVLEALPSWDVTREATCADAGCTSCDGCGDCVCHAPEHTCVPFLAETEADCPACRSRDGVKVPLVRLPMREDRKKATP